MVVAGKVKTTIAWPVWSVMLAQTREPEPDGKNVKGDENSRVQTKSAIEEGRKQGEADEGRRRREGGKVVGEDTKEAAVVEVMTEEEGLGEGKQGGIEVLTFRQMRTRDGRRFPSAHQERYR